MLGDLRNRNPNFMSLKIKKANQNDDVEEQKSNKNNVTVKTRKSKKSNKSVSKSVGKSKSKSQNKKKKVHNTPGNKTNRSVKKNQGAQLKIFDRKMITIMEKQKDEKVTMKAKSILQLKQLQSSQ